MRYRLDRGGFQWYRDTICINGGAMERILLLPGIIVLLLLAFPLPGYSADGLAWEFGGRAGYTFAIKRKNVAEYELFLRRDIPWQWQLSENLRLGFRVEGALGFLNSNHDNDVIGSLGPDLCLDIGSVARIYGGGRIVYLDDRLLRENDFGGSFQAMEDGGVSFFVGPRVTVGYRFHHMSNGDMYTSNPGLNMHLLELGIRF